MKFKNIEELMDKLNNEYKVLLDVIDNVILVIDNEMKILFVNRKGRKLIGENVLMQPCKALKMDNCSTEKCCIMRYLHGLQPLDNLHKDGSVEKVTVSRFYDNQNNPQGFIIVATDITELSNMKKELLIGEEIYKLALKQANTTLWQYDVLNHTIEQLFCPDEVALGILDINKTYYNIPESLVETKIISQEDGLRVRKLCQEIEKGRPETSIELKMKRGDGEERWISLKCSTIFDEQGRAVKSIGIGKDITDFVELKSKYEIEREYREALGKDALSYIEVNLTMNEVIDRKIAKNNFIDFYDGKNYEKSILKLSENSIPSEYGKVLRELNRQNLLNNYRDGKRKLDLEYQFYNKFKDNYNFIQITLYLIEFNKDIYACGYIKDINENKVHDLVLKKKIELDPLTGLYNREAIEIKTNEIIQNFPENNHAIMILDIDNFKQVNDNFGHLYGDAFLCEISRKIKSKFRNDDLVARLGGDEFFKIGPLKMLGDGSLGARTAFLSKPYYDAPKTRGIPVFSREEIKMMFDYANRHEMQIAIHAIGDGILDWIFEGYENALKNYSREDPRHGIVHCQITREDQLLKYQQLHLHAYIQSVFLDYDNHIINQRVSPQLAQTSYNFKTLRNITTISNGSDCPVEAPDVLKGIQLAVTRTSIDGTGPYLKEQALTREEAIESFTIGGAYASFEEEVKGTLEVGKYCDFVVLSDNILDVDVQHIKDIKVLATYVGGQLVYGGQ